MLRSGAPRLPASPARTPVSSAAGGAPRTRSRFGFLSSNSGAASESRCQSNSPCAPCVPYLNSLRVPSRHRGRFESLRSAEDARQGRHVALRAAEVMAVTGDDSEQGNGPAVSSIASRANPSRMPEVSYYPPEFDFMKKQQRPDYGILIVPGTGEMPALHSTDGDRSA